MRSAVWFAALCGQALAQQYQGTKNNNTLPTIANAELAYFRTRQGPTLLNYYSHGTNGQRIVEANIKRAVIVIHGSLRDGWAYEGDMLTAFGSGAGSATRDNVVILAPVFPNQTDEGRAYQPGDSALAWNGNDWYYGANSINPTSTPGSGSISTFDVIDQLIGYFDNRSIFPNLKTIVLAGHSRGAQLVDRYSKISTFSHTAQLIHYIANPNAYMWLTTSRPFSTASCPTYNNYPEGVANFAATPMTYGRALVAQGASAVLANYNSKIIAYGRGLRDKGDESDNCSAYTEGDSRYTRFFNWIKSDPPRCQNPATGPCQTIDYVDSGHNDLVMFSSDAGRARLFTDNFAGDGSRAYDFGYPRIQTGDDPFPNPSQT